MQLSIIRQAGFTLIELMVALSIAALLLVLVAPSYSVWVADNEVRAGAELVADGLRYAQGEAIKRNEPVQLVLDSTSGTGGWAALLVSDGSTLQSGVFVEGAERDQFTTNPPGNNSVTFTGLGQVDRSGLAPFDTVDVSSPVAGTRSLRVMLGDGATASGRVKICDTAWPATDPKGCP